jgi:hypothetical protein
LPLVSVNTLLGLPAALLGLVETCWVAGRAALRAALASRL